VPMAMDGATRERIDPKVLAALVNRFTADSADFLQAFARQAEAKLLELSQRLERLHRLVSLFEHKVRHLEPASGASAPSRPPASIAGAGDEAPAASAPAQGATADQVSAIEELAAAEALPVVDNEACEKYAVYRRMQRSGVPLLAIRQRLLMDALEDPTLDVAMLDSFDGAAGTGAGRSSSSSSSSSPVALAPAIAPAADPVVEAKPSTAPPREPAGPSGLAAAAAAVALRRRSLAQEPSGSQPAEPFRAGGASVAAEPKVAAVFAPAAPAASPQPAVSPAVVPALAASTGLAKAAATPAEPVLFSSRPPPPPPPAMKAFARDMTATANTSCDQQSYRPRPLPPRKRRRRTRLPCACDVRSLPSRTMTTSNPTSMISE
ncbi:unnamed protein product, partial [Polarella glacialis]